MPPTPSIRSSKSELRQLRRRVAVTRVRLLLAQTGTGLATALCLVTAVFATEMALDWLVHLPWLARACFSMPALGGAGWLFYSEVFLPLLRMPNDHAVACAIERAMPVFQTRLIASIQLGRVGAAKKSALVGALIRETAAMAAGEDFRKAVKTGRLVRGLRLLACVLALAGGLALLGRGNLTLLLERALLLTTRLPSRTRIEKIDCPARIAVGEDLNIEVQAGGVIPAGGVIAARTGSKMSEMSEYKLDRDPAGGGRFHAVIRSVPASLDFQVRLNDATSDPVAVTVLSPPAVLGVRCLEVFPAYTKQPSRELPTGHLSLLAGSVLRLSVAASGRVKEGSVHLAGLENDLPLSVDARAPREARGEIPIPRQGLTGFSIRLVDDNGIASRETAVYRIDIVPDRPPAIEITSPGQDEVATASATEVLAFRAVDDFGVAKVFLHYMANDSDEKVIQFDLGADEPRRLERRFEWNLGALKLAPGGAVDYWLEAVDANDVTGPGKGATEHARIKIVTDDEKRAELAGQVDDALGTLDGVSQSEDDLAKTVGSQIFQKPQAKQP